MKIGKQTYAFDNVYLSCGASIVGKKEGEGPLKDYFDIVLEDDMFGEKTFERAERKLFQRALEMAVIKADLTNEAIDAVIGGDLLNQIISSSFAAREMNIPFLGVYGACSTICESMLIGAFLLEGGNGTNILCGASSHFASAERQFRLPLEYGSQQTPTSQWTVTGAGCSLLSTNKSNIRLMHGTVGKIVDFGIKDANNMGAAMAPAAADTLKAFFDDTSTTPKDYDMLLTGDLGMLGKRLCAEMLAEEGYDVGEKYDDCGCLIFDKHENAPMGASGCGCCATVFNGKIVNALMTGEIKSVVVAATGAMLSPTSMCQGETIPGISYALHFGRVE